MLMQATKAFIFKERTSGSLIWLWGILGTVILFLLVDYLTTITLLSKIPYFNDALLYLVPIYYFSTLFLSFRAYGSSLGAYISTFFQFIGQMAVLIIFLSFWFVYSMFLTTDYQENTSSLRKSAPSFFTDVSKLSYPSDATLEHISKLKLGANFSENLLLSVSDIDSFINYAIGHYSFYRLKMNYPEFEGGEDYNVIYPDFCANFESYWEKRAAAWMEFGYKEGDDVIEGVLIHGLYKGRTEVENKDPFKNFCGTRDILFTQIKRETEIGIIMVILPKEKLVWLNSTGWF
jgi:hypothetical protein